MTTKVYNRQTAGAAHPLERGEADRSQAPTACEPSGRSGPNIDNRKRDLALFNLAIDSKLRGCDVVASRVDDVAPSGYAMDRATVWQKKTSRPGPV